jgi:hypothetical protein
MAESVSFFSESDPSGQLYALPVDYLAEPLFVLAESGPPGDGAAGGEAAKDQEPAKDSGKSA